MYKRLLIYAYINKHIHTIVCIHTTYIYKLLEY